MIQTKKHLDKFLIQAQGNSLKYANYPKKYEDLKVETRFGQGTASNIPFISLLAEDMKTSNGYYPVYLYYKDFNVLILAFGQSETHTPEITWSDNIRSKYPTIKEFLKPNKPFRYGDSFVYKAYQVNVVDISAEEEAFTPHQSSRNNPFTKDHPSYKFWGEKVTYLELPNMDIVNMPINNYRESTKIRNSVKGDLFFTYKEYRNDWIDADTGELYGTKYWDINQYLTQKKFDFILAEKTLFRNEGKDTRIPLIEGKPVGRKELATDLNDICSIYKEELNRKIVYIDRNIDDSENNYEKEELSVLEGSPKLISHFKRERNKKIVKKKKEQFKKRFGSLYCQVCDFNFKDKYGDHGEDFIECHHIIPISEMEEGHKTELKHLILLCANCHRMIHRNPKKVLTPQELMKICA